MSVLTYRRATARDLDALVALERDFPGDRISARSFRRFLVADSANVWVCVAGNDVLANAVVLYRRNSASARLYSIVVAPTARGRGIAAALVERAEMAARQRGCERLYLEVRVDNAAALALYQKLGYDVVRTIENFYEDGQNALRLERRLTTPQHLAA